MSCCKNVGDPHLLVMDCHVNKQHVNVLARLLLWFFFQLQAQRLKSVINMLVYSFDPSRIYRYRCSAVDLLRISVYFRLSVFLLRPSVMQ